MFIPGDLGNQAMARRWKVRVLCAVNGGCRTGPSPEPQRNEMGDGIAKGALGAIFDLGGYVMLQLCQ